MKLSKQEVEQGEESELILDKKPSFFRTTGEVDVLSMSDGLVH